jgi:dienelactone hydrolase
VGVLDTWAEVEHRADGRGVTTYRKGDGPGVVVLHDSPGLTPEVVEVGEHLVRSGFTVVLPHLFGPAGRRSRPGEAAVVLSRLCVSRDIALFTAGSTTPLAAWLRDLCRTVHAACGGPGVGVLGMCLTGGFALAAMVDPSVAAPVLAQPAVPVPLDRRRAGDLGLDPADLEQVVARAVGGCPVLGVRYRGDTSTGTRFETLRARLGDAFMAVELRGRGHATLTGDRHPEALEQVTAFLGDRLSLGRS